jgi:hypothetical protein
VIRYMVDSLATPPEIIAVYRQAAARNRQSPARRGNVVVLDSATADDVLVTADLHGHTRHFERIFALADLARQPRRHVVLQEVCHGGPTYPDGGCQSHRMLEEVARRQGEFPDRVHFLLSNHELAELTDFPVTKQGRIMNLAFRSGLRHAYGEQTEEVRLAMLEFLASLPLAIRVGETFICHSLPEQVDRVEFDFSVFDRPLGEKDLQPEGAAFRLVWGRDARPENAAAFAEGVGARLLLTGHQPCAGGFSLPNRQQVILDCAQERGGCVLIRPDERLTAEGVARRILFL